jgi:thiamine biosynthesis protein ThiS
VVDAMNTIVNGKPRVTEVSGAVSMPLLDFLAAHDVNPKLVAIAINGEVIPKSTFERAIVHDGDAIEIVRMVGGGAA